MLYAGGLRPAYRLGDAFRDDDPADPFAHHVAARIDGRIVAALRVIPLAATRAGFCERMFGAAVLDHLLDGAAVTREQAWEGSGWAVEPSRRGAAMGPRVLAAGAAAARRLGLRHAVGGAGRRYGQLYRILAAGYRRADGVPPVVVACLADEVALVHGTFAQLRPGFQQLVERSVDLLTWER